MKQLFNICTNESLDLEIRYAALRQMQRERKPKLIDNWRQAYKRYVKEQRKKYHVR